jgi:thiosulfate/3-mercaptopyruvate sulfurtransferase
MAIIGERGAQDLIMQCGSGVSACHNLLALEMIGLPNAPLYVGSWSEWCARDGAPIATGDA